jgi:hypothetical protein
MKKLIALAAVCGSLVASFAQNRFDITVISVNSVSNWVDGYTFDIGVGADVTGGTTPYVFQGPWGGTGPGWYGFNVGDERGLYDAPGGSFNWDGYSDVKITAFGDFNDFSTFTYDVELLPPQNMRVHVVNAVSNWTNPPSDLLEVRLFDPYEHVIGDGINGTTFLAIHGVHGACTYFISAGHVNDFNAVLTPFDWDGTSEMQVIVTRRC